MNENCEVTLLKESFGVKTPYSLNYRAKQLPGRTWNKSIKLWEVPLTVAAAKAIDETFSAHEISGVARQKIEDLKQSITLKKEYPFPAWYPWRVQPMSHQKAALDFGYGLNNLALFHEMGAGKTFTTIALACARAMENKIDAVIVICPTPIKFVWQEEIDKYSVIPTTTHVLSAGAAATRKFNQFVWSDHESGLPILIAGVESLSTGKAYDKIIEFRSRFKSVMLAVDESSRIKNDRATRTERVIAIGDLCRYRVIMTGSPVTQGIHDLYAQFRALDWKIIGIKTFIGFRNRYCIMGGFENRQIVGYDRTGELFDLLRPYIHKVKKKDVMDLPDKVYEKRVVAPTKEQKQAIKDLSETMRTEVMGEVLEVEGALDRMCRYQQIVGGNYPYKDEEGNWKTSPMKDSPKLDELLNIVEETDAKIIIWARYTPEIRSIQEALNSAYPGSAVTFYGGTVDRTASVQAFRQDPSVRFFVTNQQTGGMGLTLNESTVVVYYSNTFSYEHRIQSEDRNHRKGQTNKVTYIDLLMSVKIDRMVFNALTKKADMANFVDQGISAKELVSMGDEINEW